MADCAKCDYCQECGEMLVAESWDIPDRTCPKCG